MKQRIDAIKKLMKQHKLDAYIVPSSNEFQSQFLNDRDARLMWLTGFAGSYGSAVITLGKANYFFTDGRYIEQAKMELPAGFEVINIKEQPLSRWMLIFMGRGKAIGFDPKLFTTAQISALGDKFDRSRLVALTDNLVDEIWTDRPKARAAKINLHPLEYAGQPTKAKKLTIVEHLKRAGRDVVVITDLASISWLLNVRGEATPFAPCVEGYLMVERSGKIQFFTDNAADAAVQKYFRANDVKVHGLSELEKYLKQLDGKSIEMSALGSYWVWTQLKNPINAEDPCLLRKACKNAVELEGARRAGDKDSRAVMKCLDWIRVTKQSITELDVSNKLLELRQQEENFVSPSFPSIVGLNEHGAVMHYRPTEKTNVAIKGNGLLLIDSGGQYLEATTDATRTIAIGKPTAEQKLNFTLVLKGHIALITAVFPEGTTGSQLDVLARQYLWSDGKDYDHGTGHGVGSFLCVHEGPHRISQLPNHVALRPGMIVSVEPGFYKPGTYGIRIENLAHVEKYKFPGYLSFGVLTYIPIDESLVDAKLLTTQELSWFRAYNKKCYDK